MPEAIKLYRVKKYNPMWKSNEELKEIFGRDIFQIVCISGRIGGKTINFIQFVGLGILEHPNLDIVIMRANSSQLKQSVYIELKKFFFKILSQEQFAKVKFRESPPLMITMPAGNQIIFGGVGLGSKSGTNQSRGKTSERKLYAIAFEETQEMFAGSANGDELLKQALATYIRELDVKIGKVIYLGNRERNKNSKFNLWVKERERDSTTLIIETNWHDVEPLLTRPTISLIEQERELNPLNYKYMFLGIPVGGAMLVYGSFNQKTHIMPRKGESKTEFIDPNTNKIYNFDKESIISSTTGVLIGVDGATVNDMMVFMPIFLFKDGKMILKSKNIFQHNPKMNGQITNAILVKEYVRKWLHNFIKEYFIVHPNIPLNIIFVVDGINTDLIQTLRAEFGGYTNVIAFTKKNLVETSKAVNNAFSLKRLLITEENWIEIKSNNVISLYTLINELETVCWREDDSTKFNDSIPNDKTDGIRYPVSWYAKPSRLVKGE